MTLDARSGFEKRTWSWDIGTRWRRGFRLGQFRSWSWDVGERGRRAALICHWSRTPHSLSSPSPSAFSFS
jgi:hypothetical protein